MRLPKWWTKTFCANDLFTFILKRQNRRVYLVAFLDDHSRFVTGYGLHASQSAALVLEVLRAALDAFGCPQEVLTDNGSQYVTWRGQSAFNKELVQRGIRQVVAAPRHPQTLGKVERFWGSLWRECVEAAVFADLADARRRLGLYIGHYNFRQPHQGIGGAVPADRFFGADSVVRRALEARVAANALALARQGLPRPPFYLAGQAGGQDFSPHAEGERVTLTDAAGNRWTRAGSVWAVDFVKPPGAIAGQYGRVLAVRDLGSGMQLAWEAVADESASSAVGVLRRVAAWAGAPLVVKNDNGGAFRSGLWRAEVAGLGAWVLYSPAYRPGYNGSAEAGNESLKRRREALAAAAGHPGEWRLADLGVRVRRRTRGAVRVGRRWRRRWRGSAGSR